MKVGETYKRHCKACGEFEPAIVGCMKGDCAVCDSNRFAQRVLGIVSGTESDWEVLVAGLIKRIAELERREGR